MNKKFLSSLMAVGVLVTVGFGASAIHEHDTVTTTSTSTTVERPRFFRPENTSIKAYERAAKIRDAVGLRMSKRYTNEYNPAVMGRDYYYAGPTTRVIVQKPKVASYYREIIRPGEPGNQNTNIARVSRIQNAVVRYEEPMEAVMEETATAEEVVVVVEETAAVAETEQVLSFSELRRLRDQGKRAPRPVLNSNGLTTVQPGFNY